MEYFIEKDIKIRIPKILTTVNAAYADAFSEARGSRPQSCCRRYHGSACA